MTAAERSGAAGGRVAAGAAGVRQLHGYLDGVGGVRLFYRSWEPPAAEGAVLVVHGLGEHSGRYARLGRALASEGVAVHALDLRGHGRSRGRRGTVRRLTDYLRDVDRLRRRITGGPSAPDGVVLVGHSMGGLVVLRYAQELPSPDVRGVVAMAPFVDLAAPVPGWKLALGRLADRWVPGLTMDNEMDPDLLMRTAEEREAYRSDPLVHGRISARLWGEMLRESRRLREDAGRLNRPLLLQLPGSDRVVDAGAARRFAGELEGRVHVREYPEAYHDLYHDPAAPEAVADVVAWTREALRS